MKLIVGLGNPGPKYAMTRHNVGFMVLDLLSMRERTRFRREWKEALVAEFESPAGTVRLVKPQGYMNRSGSVVKEALERSGADIEDLLVVHDDFHLPLGKLRFRASGSAGGHNGLKDIIEWLDRNDVPRLKIGIGGPPPGADPADHVLTAFSPSERDRIRDAIETAAEAIDLWVSSGSIQECMNRYH